MHLTTEAEEATMYKKHLTRLSVMAVTCSILVAMHADLALAALKGK